MISNLTRRVRGKSSRAIVGALQWRLARPWHLFRVRNAPEYVSPTEQDLLRIESELCALGVPVNDYRADIDQFHRFCATVGFPPDYHGGPTGGVYREKMLEHFVAYDLLELARIENRVPYIDVAGAASPWAKLLRAKGIEAFSIDLERNSRFTHLDYYLQCDATATPFTTASVGSASLQCAFEMFQHDSDTRLIAELARILRPGGRAVISPLYMHTHACCYQSPEYYGRSRTDEGAVTYVRRSASRIPSSRKYSATALLSRVWWPALAHRLRPAIYALRNRASLGPDIYLHFILVLDRDEDERSAA